MGGCCSSGSVAGGAHERLEVEEGDGQEFFETENGDGDGGSRIRLKGASRGAAMFTQQGWKGINQDAMTIWKDFAGDIDKTYCGIFDGHGPNGHNVSSYVRDNLPSEIYLKFKSSPSSKFDYRNGALDANGCQKSNAATAAAAAADDDDDDKGGEEWVSAWRDKFIDAFKEIDEKLRSHPDIDCLCSGATAVSVLKEKERLIIANLGDSRAILGTRDAKNHLVPVQLTVDLKPNLPSEAERIKRCGGRINSISGESDVHRMWLPDDDSPGLAMARAFGDFCLKDFGLVSIPQIFYRKLLEKDEFLVLATDGIWDVLSNKEVIRIVASAKKRSDSAKKVVKRAVRAWKMKLPTSLIDDCTVICIFLKFLPSSTNEATQRTSFSTFSEFSCSESFKTTTTASEYMTEPEDMSIGGFSRVSSTRSDRHLKE